MYWYDGSLYWSNASLYQYICSLYRGNGSMYWYNRPRYRGNDSLYWYNRPRYRYNDSLCWYIRPLYRGNDSLYWYIRAPYRYNDSMYWYIQPMYRANGPTANGAGLLLGEATLFSHRTTRPLLRCPIWTKNAQATASRRRVSRVLLPCVCRAVPTSRGSTSIWSCRR
jgi:hypothetical protein